MSNGDGIDRRKFLGGAAAAGGVAAAGAVSPAPAGGGGGPRPGGPRRAGGGPARGGPGRGDDARGQGGGLVPRDRLGVQQGSLRDAIPRLDGSVSGYLGGAHFPDDPTDLGPLVPLPGGFASVFKYLASVG